MQHILDVVNLRKLPIFNYYGDLYRPMVAINCILCKRLVQFIVYVVIAHNIFRLHVHSATLYRINHKDMTNVSLHSFILYHLCFL